ncbi:MAG: neutral/alkaline non-lysosomal ceramidase N-terminal domain-containing protein [bacterium]
MLQAGTAKIDITPPVGIELTGFIYRQQPSVGVHDPLFAKAVVIDDGTTQLALVSCDLLALSRDSVKTIRQKITKNSGIPSANILIACTHTHSGPATVFLRNCGTVDKGWLSKLEQQIADTVIHAYRELQPVSMGYGFGTADISLDRRASNLPQHAPEVVDKSLGVIKFEDISGEPMALILNYTCHPVVMAEKNRYFSADYPGVVCDYLESNYPSDPVVLFFNGACGNINPNIRGGTWEAMTKLGEIIGKAAADITDTITTSDTLTLSAINDNIELQLKIPHVEGIDHELEMFRNRAVEIEESDMMQKKYNDAMIWWAEETLDILKQKKAPESIPLEIQVMKLGELTIAALGGEIFCQIGLNIKQQSGSPTFIIGYANHDIGYIPTRKAFEEGGYEVTMAYRYYGNFMITRDADHIIETSALHLIKSV